MGHKLLGYEFRSAKKMRHALRFVFAVLFFAACFSTPCRARSLRVVEYYHTLHQRFYCTTGYIPSDCMRDLAVLQQLLNQYHAESLGEWHWVIVAKTQWKAFSLEMGFPAISPAMTSLEDRATLLEESLFSAEEERAGELEQHFRVPWRELLSLALTHELGHALCRDGSEIRAELFAERLRGGFPGSCNP